jgi:hypothetical protein
MLTSKKGPIDNKVTTVKMRNSFQKFTLLAAAVLVFTSASARKIPGKIVDGQGIAIDVIFKIPFKFLSSEVNYEKIQYRIAYYDASGSKKLLRPSDAREIVFKYDNEDVRMLSRPDNLHSKLFSSDTHIFLRLLIDGKMKLFNYYYTQTSPGFYDGSTGAMSGGANYTRQLYPAKR